MLIINLDECPCSGKNMSTLVAPWILPSSKRRYYLTEGGRECLWRWLRTLGTPANVDRQITWRGQTGFPKAILPKVVMGKTNQKTSKLGL